MSVSVNTADGPIDVTDFRFRGLRKVLVMVEVKHILFNNMFVLDPAW